MFSGLNSGMIESMDMRQHYTIGVDEAGRGPLAGPVSVGAVAVSRALSPAFRTIFRDIKESKQINEKKREEWFAKLVDAREKGILDFSVMMVGAPTIDRVGIVQAIRSALLRALLRLGNDPDTCRVLLDGSLRAPAVYFNQTTIIRGDETKRIIAAASVAAKVARDRKMERLALRFPDYGFERHKGYGTEDHIARIRTYGIVEGVHRRSFLGDRISDGSP